MKLGLRVKDTFPVVDEPRVEVRRLKDATGKASSYDVMIRIGDGWRLAWKFHVVGSPQKPLTHARVFLRFNDFEGLRKLVLQLD